MLVPFKCDDLKDILTDEYWPWIAQYLVMKRASIEFNFHALYSNFLDVLKVPELNKMVVRETFRNIKVLLQSDKGIANFSDRSLLKNLGHWLGMLTLARNKPILQNDMDLKALLGEAYHNGQQELLYVVPFVAKVLEACAKSKVYTIFLCDFLFSLL
jgi:CCR4-NOT transcription complex subunit 1